MPKHGEAPPRRVRQPSPGERALALRHLLEDPDLSPANRQRAKWIVEELELAQKARDAKNARLRAARVAMQEV